MSNQEYTAKDVLTDDERADYMLLGRAAGIIEWLLDARSERSREHASEAANLWLAEYRQRLQKDLDACEKGS